jgi:hypothetical protein
VGFELTGWFGGAGAQGDWAALTARFLSASESVVGSNTVGQVTPTDRGGVTGLLLRRAEGTLPAGTRFVEFTLTNHVTAGANDGSADNLSFVLTPPPFSITAYGEVPGGWQVTFKGSPRALYVLERSSTLQSWSDASPPTAGGAAVSLVDTNAPFGPAFYRIAWRRP